MKNIDKDFISQTLGVEPIQLNSASLTAQTRNRLFRTNIPGIEQPIDAGVFLSDVLETAVPEKYFTNRQQTTSKKFQLTGNEDTPCSLIEVMTEIGKQKQKRHKKMFGIRKTFRGSEDKMYLPRTSERGGKSNCLTNTQRAINHIVIGGQKDGYGQNNIAVRKLTPLECERLQ